MKGFISSALFACASIICGVLPANLAFAGHPETPAFQAGAGVLSYSFFNLSGLSCNITANGSQTVSTSGYTSASWSASGSDPAFFNNGNPSGNGGWVFYNNQDPINSSTLPSTFTLDNGTGTGSNGQTIQILSSETGQNWSINYPAMGDSWSTTCNQNGPVVLATLASSGSSLQSGWYGSLTGSIANANITPTGNSNPLGDGCSANNANPCGADFAPQGMNWNLAPNNPLYKSMGALWSAITYTSNQVAATTFNFAILPINFSAYTESNAGINFTDMTPNVQTYYSSLYGGHTGITIGDPFLVSSFSAKMLWFLATSSTPINNGTNMSSISSVLSNVSGSGVFSSGSYEDAYVQWFVGSKSSSLNYPGQPLAAASAFNAAYKAASVPIDKESIWGTVYTALANICIEIIIHAMDEIPGVPGVIISGTAAGIAGTFTPDMESAITNATQYSTTGAPPSPSQSPPIYNGTFASTNLFGLFLSNVGVQSEINTLLTNVPNPNPLWSNYDISTSQICSSIGVSNNLMQGNCYGSNTTQQVANGSASKASVGTYTNVYSKNQTTTEFSIWNAIISGSNISTNPSGYMILSGENQYPSFSPPTVVVNASSSNLPANNIIVNTAFNPNTGYISASSVGAVYSPYLAYNSTAAPSAAPSLTSPSALQSVPPGLPPVTWEISIPGNGITYNGGVLTINQYCYTIASNTAANSSNTTCTTPANGPQKINMTQCMSDSMVYVGDSLVDASITATDPPSVNISLACQSPPTALSNVTLNYSNCSNDQWASGGVYAAVTTPPNFNGTVGEVVLACACVPSYLDGPLTSTASKDNQLGGYLVGATSSRPKQTCPKPAA